ncbi:MAG TPA: c-type cytochrome [Gammaproteobacteria bacterium]|jgi:cytochrome c oxidase subunit 2|nr:c-type cytochrome [Gammaproteobacteria bacterium]MDP7094289.1 c-type cytochrome [Gammaproteobacteria bacterium]HJP40055.1 c-type cytochrome [Gammaproteobacteria bacterium]
MPISVVIILILVSSVFFHPACAETTIQVEGDPVMGKTQYMTCAACHGFAGEGNSELKAPKLSGQEAWYFTRQLDNYKQGIRGKHEKDVFGQQMAGVAPLLTDDQAVRNVAAYVESLPDEPAATTVSGDVSQGASIFVTCSACHGSQGEGVQALNAPRLAGMSDWYLVNQLKNFQRGIRGGQQNDLYGKQMMAAVAFLTDEQAINNLVAYINTL